MKQKMLFRVGSEEKYGPRPAGEILQNQLETSNEPLAVAYRERNGEAPGWHRNTELCVDLKTLLRSDSRLEAGKSYTGVLRRDVECEEFNLRSTSCLSRPSLKPLKSATRSFLEENLSRLPDGSTARTDRTSDL